MVAEERRELLQQGLATHLGAELATLLISELPPVDWSEIATKSDLAELRTELRSELNELRGELGAVKLEVIKQTRVFVATMGGVVVAMSGAMAALGG